MILKRLNKSISLVIKSDFVKIDSLNLGLSFEELSLSIGIFYRSADMGLHRYIK